MSGGVDESSCGTYFGGEDNLPMSRVEKLARMTAERTVENGQRRFDTRVRYMLGKFEAERLLLKD